MLRGALAKTLREQRILTQRPECANDADVVELFYFEDLGNALVIRTSIGPPNAA